MKKAFIVVLMGFMVSIALLEIGLRLGGFAIRQWQYDRNHAVLRRGGEYRILCLGDSVTAGGYPRFLQELLDRRLGERRYAVIDRGQSGIGTAYIVSSLRKNLDAYKPHMVIIMMGTNYFSNNSIPYERNRLQSFAARFRVYRLILLIREQLLQRGLLRRISRVSVAPPPMKTAAAALLPQPANRYEKVNDDARAADQYYLQRNFEQTIASAGKAIAAGYRKGEVYLCLARAHFFLKQYAEAEAAAREGIACDPICDLYDILGNVYLALGKTKEAEQAFRDALALQPDNQESIVVLTYLYMQKGRLSQVEQILGATWQRDSLNERLLGALAVNYLNKGRKREADECFRKAEAIRARYYDPQVKADYLQLVREIRSRGIKLLCVQYPVRALAPLQQMLARYADSIVFVDNEALFKQELAHAAYNDLFKDQFGGDFGHLTDKGCRMLAENVAAAVQKELR